MYGPRSRRFIFQLSTAWLILWEEIRFWSLTNRRSANLFYCIIIFFQFASFVLSVKYGGKYVLIQPFHRLFTKFPSCLHTRNYVFFKFQNPSFSHRADAKWSLRDRETRVWWTDRNRDVLQDSRVILHAKQGTSEPGWIIPRNVDRVTQSQWWTKISLTHSHRYL